MTKNSTKIISILGFTLIMLFSFKIAKIEAADINFRDDGTLVYEATYATAAEGAIRYKVLDWYMHSKPTCTSSSHTGECAPKTSTGGSDWWIHLPASGSGYTQNSVLLPDGRTRTTYTWSADAIERAILQADKLDEIKSRQIVYFSARMRSEIGPRNNPTVRKGPFDTLSGIVNAEVWSTPWNIRQNFDVQAVFATRAYDLNMILKTESGETMETIKIGRYKAGEEIKKSFPKYFKYKGKDYFIYSSYLSRKLTPDLKRYLQKIDDPINNKVIERNFFIYVGGTDMIATYSTAEEAPDPVEPPPSSCSYSLSSPNSGGSMSLSRMNPNSNAIIRADSRGSERFDVSRGIPTSESLYSNTFGNNYIFDQSFISQNGKVSYEIPVKKLYTLSWKEKQDPICDDKGKCKDQPDIPHKNKEWVSTVVNVDKDYNYWIVQRLKVYGLSSSTLYNYALPGGSITMHPYGYSPPSLNVNHNSDVYQHVFPECVDEITLPETEIDGGYNEPSVPTSAFESEARSEANNRAKPPRVKNDKVIFNGSTVMSDQFGQGSSPAPSNIPEPSIINQNTLYRDNMVISNSLANRLNAESSGNISYSHISTGNSNLDMGASSVESFPIYGINSVTVHTPTVMYPKASDDKEHDQRTDPPNRSTPANPDDDRHAFILDRPFTVDMPNSGNHRSILGYGNRDYSKYIKKKEVKFPFDVYSETKQFFYSANTWIEIPVSMEKINFFMPVWVPEGEYIIDFRSFAINSLNGGDFGGSERKANTTIPNGIISGHSSAAHVATSSIKVDVVGRVYDFNISNINDYNWKDTFVNKTSPPRYWVGTGDIDGSPRNNLFSLPIGPGSHPDGYKNVSIKPGYSFMFDLKTKGDMYKLSDGIRITPKFYVIDKITGARKEVDVHYHKDDKKFVTIGSSEDDIYRNISLNRGTRRMDVPELNNNIDYYFDHAVDFGFSGTENMFKNTFARDYLKNFTKEPITTGPYAWQMLNWRLRTFISPTISNSLNTMIPNNQIVSKEQKWYGEYSLPSEIFITDKGVDISKIGFFRDINKSNPLFIQDGYLVLNFNIETIKSGDVNNPYLQYINAPLSNQWKDMEKSKDRFIDGHGKSFDLIDGDVVLYNIGESSNDDFSSSLTH